MGNTINRAVEGAFWDWVLLAVALIGIFFHFFLMLFSLPETLGFQIYDLPLFIVILVCGIPLAFNIILSVLKGNFGTDLLAVISLTLAVFLGENLAAVLVIVMMAGGQALETYAVKRASNALLALVERMPSIAHKKIGDRIEDIKLDEIQIGDEIVIYPHETVPVDGVVVSGFGSMDESYLTGEPYGVSKAPGSSVISGAINGESMIVISAEKLATDSRYAQILKVMSDAQQKKPSSRRIGDKLGSFFTPVVLVFAITTWVITRDPTRFLAVIITATPCPLLIAIPITIISAISIAARSGIIVKDPTALELLPKCKTAIFDKTGTLTYGKPVLTEVIVGKNFEKNDVLQKVASVERYSKHPLAEAVIKAANEAKLYLREVSAISEKPGEGLVGKIEEDEIKVTHRKKLSYKFDSLLPPSQSGLECVILINEKYAATFRFLDTPRSDGKSFIDHLKPSHNFTKVMLVSGDRESEVKNLSMLLGIKDILFSQSPEQKVAIVREEMAKNPTMFMGDGINDAPAIASATVGIAFGQHTSVTAEAANVVILENSLKKVDELIHISSKMRSILLQSAIGGMVLSVIAMSLASVGYITPVYGALLQEIIDVVAITNALRLTLIKKIQTDYKQ